MTLSESASEWRLLQETHPNVLVIGPSVVMDDALRALTGVCRHPVSVRLPTNFGLPAASDSGTLILRDVERISVSDQSKLMAWLGHANGRAQVVSTSARAVWQNVESGAFLRALYYRLNVVYVDLAGRGAHLL